VERAVGGRERSLDVDGVFNVFPAEAEDFLPPKAEPERQVYRGDPRVGPGRGLEDHAAELRVDELEPGAALRPDAVRGRGRPGFVRVRSLGPTNSFP
jgi:hypothetical protein